MITIDNINPDTIANNLTPFCATHPGEVLKDEVEERGISQKELAKRIGVSYRIVNEILNERRPITTETAMLFEAALGIPANTLLSLQMDYNIYTANQNKSFLARIASIGRVAAVL